MQGSPLFWDMAQLQEGQSRTVPMSFHCPLSLGMAGAALQQLTLLAAAHSSVVPNSCQVHTCPALQGRAGLRYLLWSNLRVLRTHSFPAFNEQSEMLPVAQTARCAFVRGNSPGNTEKLNLEKWALESQVSLQLWCWRAARNTSLGSFLLWRESRISHNSLQHLCA